MKKFRSIQSVLGEIWRWRCVTADLQSWIRIALDVVLVKICRPSNAIQHTIGLKKFGQVSYRFNKGDIWSLREVLLDECYRFPGGITPHVVVDLGGNIGLTSLWMARTYGDIKLVTVEPVLENAALARQNLMRNGVVAHMIEAAAGSRDGTARFAESEESNKGRLCPEQPGMTRVISMPALLNESGITGDVDLLKVDIEGGEADLFSGDLKWLSRVKSIIIELHADRVDAGQIISTIESQGFRFIPGGSVFKNNMEAFVAL